jgi:PTH2 family peptidyl-tRNA hydrolase
VSDTPSALDPRLLGVWQLIGPVEQAPDQAPPPHAVTTLLADAAGLFVHTRWRDAGGVSAETALRVVPDGEAHPLPEQEGATIAAMVFGGGLTLELCQGGEVVLRSTRRVSPRDGDLLEVVDELAQPDGSMALSGANWRRCGVKQVLVYRRDLKMRKGKIAAQCAHASLAVFLRRDEGGVDRIDVPLDGPMAYWASRGFAKVVLSVDTEADLLRVHREAQARGLPSALITDSGKTEFGGVPTRTAVALGPATTDEIDAITGPEGLVATKLA